MADNVIAKRELIEMAADNAGVSKTAATSIINAFFDVTREALREGDTVRLTDFGIISIKERGPRKGRNIRTGKAITIAASKKISFRPSTKLKKLVNGESDVD